MSTSDLPSLNAALNGLSTLLLIAGYIHIKAGQIERHKAFMIATLISSSLFLVSYLIYHYSAGSVPYPHHDWTRPVYFAILIPHIILAAVMLPFIVAAVYYAVKKEFDKHKRITRYLWPVWMFVSVSGIIVYLMLYHT